jgi:hypothetical protein
MSKARSRAGDPRHRLGAHNEEYIYDRNGRLDNAGFLDYRVPVASNVPMIEAVFEYRNEDRHGRFATRMAEMKADLVKWLVGVGFAQMVTILAVLKLFPDVHP